jgi:hypothetical protein
MSTDWNIHCVDCNDTLTFNDANHCDTEMATIIRHADVIAALVPLMNDLGHWIEFKSYYGDIDPRWFAQHRGHRLRPISEYGHFLEQCATYVKCGCGSSQRCKLDDGHVGECTSVAS